MSKRLLSDSLSANTPKPLAVSLEALEQQHDIDLTLEEQSHSLEMLFQQEEELINSIASLERMYDNIAAMDTLSQESREAYALTLESMFGEHALPPESISLEGVGSFLGRLRQALANVRGRIARSTKDFFSRLFEGIQGLKDRLEAIEARGKEIEKMSRLEGYMVARGGSRLHVNKTMDPAKLAETLPEIAKDIRTYKNAIVDGGMQFIQHIEDTQKKINELEEPTKEDVKKINDRAKKNSESIARNIEDEIGSFNNYQLTGGLKIVVFSQISFHIDYTTKTEESPKIARPVNMNKMGAYKEKQEVRIPSPDEIEAIQSAMMNLLDGLMEDHEKTQELILKTSRAKRTAERVVKINKNLDYNPNMSIPENIVNVLITLVSNYFGNHLNRWALHIDENVFALYKYQYQVARSAISYMESSLKQYP